MSAYKENQSEQSDKTNLTIDLMMIVGKYFENAADYINVMKLSHRYKYLNKMYRYNPIPDASLFPLIQTQHFYTESDMKNKIKGLFCYVFWYKVNQVKFFNKNSNEIYKNVILTNYATIKNVNGKRTRDCKFIPDDQTDNSNLEYIDEFINDNEINHGHELIELKDGLCRIPEGITELDKNCFELCQITKIILPNSLKKIGNDAFRSTNIKEIDIPNGVTELGDYVFSECWDLKNVNLPSSLIKIGDWCFCFLCLPSLIVPDSVKSVNENAFYDVNQLFLPDHLKHLRNN